MRQFPGSPLHDQMRRNPSRKGWYSTQDMKLYQLAYACRLYQGDFDDAYRQMRNNLRENPDLASVEQQDHLMHFLNKWGCRIPKTQFDNLKNHLKEWAEKWVCKLPDVGSTILDLKDDVQRDNIANSFNALLTSHFQETSVAKTLHALRHRTLPPWDAYIKKKCCSPERTPGQAYFAFIQHVLAEIRDLERDVKRLGYSLNDVPRLVKRVEPYGVSLVKLVDEYHWMTITSGHTVPDQAEIEAWLCWTPPS